MKKLLFVWWSLFAPVNVNVFFRSMEFACLWLKGDSAEMQCFRLLTVKTAFQRCSEDEQAFLFWKYPVLNQVMSELKGN